MVLEGAKDHTTVSYKRPETPGGFWKPLELSHKSLSEFFTDFLGGWPHLLNRIPELLRSAFKPLGPIFNFPRLMDIHL